MVPNVQNVQKKKKKKFYYCEVCDYNTKYKTHFTKHLNTAKHIKNMTPRKLKSAKIDIEKCNFCEICFKVYNTRSGLYKHRQKCKPDHNIYSKKVFPDHFEKVQKIRNVLKNNEILSKTKNLEEDNILEKNRILEENRILKKKVENLETQKELERLKLKNEFLKKQNNSLEKLVKHSIVNNNTVQHNYNNCGNQKVSINVFLNNQCKDALNLTDFVENIKVTLEDLKYSKDNGFVNGVSNIIKKQLQDLKPTERPIHCSDKKRLQFYVKENNEWSKDVDNVKIDNTIRDIKLKQSKSITEWEKLNPTYKNDPKLRDEWCAMLAGITEGDTGNALKEKQILKRKIASYMELKDAMNKSNNI